MVSPVRNAKLLRHRYFGRKKAAYGKYRRVKSIKVNRADWRARSTPLDCSDRGNRKLFADQARLCRLIPDGAKPALRIARNTQLALIYSTAFSGYTQKPIPRQHRRRTRQPHTIGFRRKGIR